MSFSFRRTNHWDVAELMGDKYVLPDGCDLVRIARRMPDGQVFAQIFIVNMQDRKSAAAMIHYAKQDVRKRTDSEWAPGRDMLSQEAFE